MADLLLNVTLLSNAVKNLEGLNDSVSAFEKAIEALRQPLWLDEAKTVYGKGLRAIVQVGESPRAFTAIVPREPIIELLVAELAKLVARRDEAKATVDRAADAIRREP